MPAKLTQYVNPVSGQRGSILDLGGLWRMILGAMVLVLIFGLGQSLAAWVRRLARVPTATVTGAAGDVWRLAA